MTTERIEVSEAKTIGNGSGAFDRVTALELTERDEELLRDLIILFRQESAGLVAQLESAIVSGDCDSVRKAAHRLKGASATVGGVKIAATARILETMGATKALIDANGMLAQLQGLIGEYDRATAFFGKEPQ